MIQKERIFIICVLFFAISMVFYAKKTSKYEPQIIPPEQPPDYHPPYFPEPQRPQPKPEPPKPIEPEWTTYPPQRNVTNLGKVLSDIESHMPAGHIYRDSDKITWAHETTHGINSHLRMKFSRGYRGRDDELDIFGRSVWKIIDGKPVFHAGRINGFYCLENRASIIEEPPTTMRAAAAMVPRSLRGSCYNLYMVQQARSWGDTPLYICDEWIAYTNGSDCRLDLGIQSRSETISQTLEFDVYALALAMAIKKNCPGYDDKQFKAFLMWNLERSFKIYKNEERAHSYLNAWKTAPDAEELRRFTRQYCGAEWTKRILGF